MPNNPMTCEDAIALLLDYLELTLGKELLAALEGHLAGCEPCRAYLNTYRKTRELTGKAAPRDMPAELRDRLRGFLRERVLRGEI